MSDDSQAMTEWLTAVSLELGLEGQVDSDKSVDAVLDLTSEVAHGVSRPAAPVTAFLIGVAAGRADDPQVAAADYAQKIAALAAGWGADTERGVASNDQSQRG
ncbi:DUF6457 domain-containing protein [Pseudonocardia xishanensis]|uniref:DUF6457 domain-containing protein n=1 Tax=Pseudonocardia xishanensis TaxID=630995 RepID=A0ABP8RY26_9PSEU